VLATLIKVRRDRSPLPIERLLERLQLVQWLRGELAAVESLLTDEYDRVRRAGTPVPGGTPSPAEGSGAPAAADGSDVHIAG
jgi:hypothetical protein